MGELCAGDDDVAVFDTEVQIASLNLAVGGDVLQRLATRLAIER
jgi:hypothetical protein